MTALVAIVANAHRNPSIEFEVAHEVNGEWYTNADVRVWPFWIIDFDDLARGFIWEDVSIPNGWIEHLHAEAAHYAANRPSPKEDRANGTSLLASLGLPTKVHSSVSGTLKRRI
jgi:hypothetical protein